MPSPRIFAIGSAVSRRFPAAMKKVPSTNTRLFHAPAITRSMATAVDPSQEDFKFPAGTRYRILNPQMGLARTSDFADALNKHGILSIEMKFPDPSSSFILDVVKAMGCEAQSHSSKDGALWDITWKPEGQAKDPSGKASSNVWSHSLDEMSWHTDGSFEKHPMPFFGFHIIRSDHHGGGRFRVLAAQEIARKLSPEAWDILTTKEFDLRVPPEFQKSVGSVKGKLVRVDEEDPNKIYLRYRSSVIKDPPSDDPKANEAVAELQSLLHDSPEDIGQAISTDVFGDNSILLMDNARFLHSRTPVQDEKRWLRRVRFEGTPGQARP